MLQLDRDQLVAETAIRFLFSWLVRMLQLDRDQLVAETIDWRGLQKNVGIASIRPRPIGRGNRHDRMVLPSAHYVLQLDRDQLVAETAAEKVEKAAVKLLQLDRDQLVAETQTP